MRTRKRPIWMCLSIGVLSSAALVLPAASSASTTVGQIQTGGITICNSNGAESITSVVSSGATYVVPSAGVITRWRTDGTANDAGDTLALRVYQKNSASSFTPVFDSGFETLTSGSVNEFTTRAPVSGGEFIGLVVGTGAPSSCTSGLYGAPNETLFNGMPGAVGSPATFSFGGDTRADIEAVVEPDADGDGFGDETQDQCPANPARQALPCDSTPPETSITKKPKEKTRKTQANIEFASSEVGSSFECSLDGEAFRGCISPRLFKAGVGKHVFQVRATDGVGNVDPSPARVNWTVKKKKKKGGH